jgi:DNA-binding MarR family transcriptional regulator
LPQPALAKQLHLASGRRMKSSPYICLDKCCSDMYIPSMTAFSQAPHRLSSRFDSLEQEAFLNLWRTYDRLRALEDELFGKWQLTPQQYNVLRLLSAQHPMAIPTLTLADRLVSRAPDITRILDKLQRRGFVVRQRPADNRRQVLVAITEEGLRLLRDIAESLRDCHKRQLGHLAPGKLKLLVELLQEARRPHEDVGGSWR